MSRDHVDHFDIGPLMKRLEARLEAIMDRADDEDPKPDDVRTILLRIERLIRELLARTPPPGRGQHMTDHPWRKRQSPKS